MSRLPLLFLTTAIISTLAVTAQARIHHGGAAPGSACPYGFAFDDGCSGADQTAIFKDPLELSQYQQSGQTSILPTHPFSFNAPGYDYPLGPTAAAAAAYKIFGVDATPNNCSYSATGSIKGGPKLTCSTTSTPTTISGWDTTFGGTTCTVMSFGGAGTGLISVTSNKIALTSNCVSEGVITKLSNAPIKIWNNYFDGGYPGVTSGDFFFVDNSSGTVDTVDIKYNVLLNVAAARIFGGARGCAARTFRYNYLNNLNPANTAHAEIDLYGGQGGCASPISSVDWSFNFLGLQQTPSQAGDAIFYPSTGALNNIKSANTAIVGNIIVTNKDTGGNRPWGAGVFSGGWASLGNFTYTDNYIDYTGMLSCGVNGRLGQGTQNTASTSGNQITITVGAALGPRIMAGYIIKKSGFTDAFITGQVSGTPLGSGVYTFDGVPQTVASSTGWILTPGYTNANIARNISLYDGSAATFPLPAGDGASCARSP